MDSSSSESEKEFCSFYQRIGSCRHGNKCSRIHKPPKRSRTIMIRNLFRYVQPSSAKIASNSPDDFSIFEDFYEEVFTEIDKEYGSVIQMHVCENMGEHLVGNVYIKFKNRKIAENAVKRLNNRYFAGFPIYAELSPVNDFRDAVCRQHDMGECSRGGFCNFLHIKHISDKLDEKLYNKSYCSTCSEDESDYSESTKESISSYSVYLSESCSDVDSVNSNTLTDVEEDEVKSEIDQNIEDEVEDDSPLPKAFRPKPLRISDSKSSDEDDNEENQYVKEYLQTGRRLRWKIFQKKLIKENEKWDDDKEQQYVFQLLDLT